MTRRPDRIPRFLFVNENIGGHRTVHRSLRKIFADHTDVAVEFLDGEDPGLLGKILRAPIPGLARLDLDLQPLRGQLVHSWRMRRKVRARVARGDIDAMHVYTQNTLLGGAKLLRETPTVITTDSTGRLNVFSIPYRTPTRFTVPLSRVNLIFERPVLKAAATVFACSAKVAESLRSADYELPPQQVARLEMGVHSPYFAAPLPPRDPYRTPTIVFVGTSLERKGGTLLLELWRSRFRQRANLTLITLETPPAEEGLTVINDLQPGEDRLWEILADADIFCLPSLIDQAPNAILEAMAAGLPVVAHPNGAIPEMVRDGETGFLVDATEPGPVAAALEKLIADPELRERLGQAGYRHAREHYDMSRSAGQIITELRRAARVMGEQSPENLTFRLHHHVDVQLHRQWEDLAERHGGTFGARPSYALNWYRTLGKGRLAVATVHDGGQLVGLLPLHTRRRLGITTYRLLGHGLGTIGEALAADRAALDALVLGLRRARALLRLTHVPADSPLLRALLDSGTWTVNYDVDDHCPVIALPDATTARDLRSRKSLNRLRTSRNRAERELGAVEFHTYRQPADLTACWPEMTRVAAAAHAAETAERLNFFDAGHRKFTREFLRAEAESGRLLIIALTVDAAWVAFTVLLRTGDRAEFWFTRFDPAHRPLAPGHQLWEYTVNHHAELGLAEIDLMIGRNAYKADWQTSEYEVGTVRATPATRAWLLPVEQLVSRAAESLRRLSTGQRTGPVAPAGPASGGPRTTPAPTAPEQVAS
ncbi:GNAT family N-acetyltransferase [Corynebacterium halotolerans]|uniref:GNAT family N-acetyltransferase n=1 Tax=Corynebacterium halotolerans TaxID=225326 RepID=UPI003CEF18A0